MGWLTAAGWTVAVEASFSIFGERGSIDVFAWHPAGGLLVIEVKASVGEANQTLIAIDRKIRLAPAIGNERGWPAGPVGAILFVAATTTSRRRIGRHEATFRASLPNTSAECRRWATSPLGRPARGILFLETPDSRAVNNAKRS